MKKRNLLFFSFILSIGIGLFSCNMGDTGNIQTYEGYMAVVDSKPEMGGMIICTSLGNFAAPSLNFTYFGGECLYIFQFTLDLDNQPSDKYLTATDIVKADVDQSYLNEWSDPFEPGNFIPMSDVGAASNIFYQGRLFLLPYCKDKNPNFRLIYFPNDDETDNVKDFYFQAMPSSSTSETSDVLSIHAVNLESWITENGRDSTLTVSGTSEKINIKYIKANLNYVSKITDGIPEYEKMGKDPFDIYILDNQ